MKSKKILASVLSAVIISSTIFLGGCGTEETKPTTSNDKMDADQTINLVGYEYKTLDPALASDRETFNTYTQVYEGLVREVTKDGKVTTELAGAESMKVNDDKTVYTFKIRDSKWSDGKPVRAQDYVFEWKRQADPANASEYMTFMAEIGVKGADELMDAVHKKEKDKYAELLNNLGVKALDDKTLEVTLKQPVPYFVSALAFKGLVPAREDLCKAQGDKYGSDYKTMVYNGPFVIADFQKGSKIVYKKNENYWNKKNIKLNTANCFVIEEPQTIVKMFQGKELDMCGPSGDDLAKLQKEAKAGNYLYTKDVEADANYLYYNVERPVIKNAKVRLAISLAFNRQQYLDVVFKRMVPSWGMVPGGILVGNKDYRKAVKEPLKSIKEDPKKLMTEGLSEAGITDPSKVTFSILNGKVNSTRKATSEYLQKMLKDTFGINLKIVYSVDSPTYFSERAKGNFDLCAGGWGADYSDVSSFFACFLSDSQNNNGKYKNEQYDNLVRSGAKETDPSKRIKLYKDAEELLINKDAALVPLYYQDVHNFRQNYVKGMYLPKFGAYYDLSRVYISGKK